MVSSGVTAQGRRRVRAGEPRFARPSRLLEPRELRTACWPVARGGSRRGKDRPSRATERPAGGSLVHRYYDPQTGQFLTLDPLVDQTEQPYGYAGQDPIKSYDLEGTNTPGTISGSWSTGLGVALGFAVVAEGCKQSGLCNAAGSLIQKKIDDLITSFGNTPSPALPGSPYSPGEVSKRQSAWRRHLGAPLLDPDSPIPDQGTKPNTGQPAKPKSGHPPGERNVGADEEHSRTPKGNPYFE